jgi:hypothetical protein
MSQPRVDAQGRPIKPDPRANATPAPKAAQTPPPKPAPEANVAPVDDTPPGKPDPNRKVRSVGPPFITTQ